MNLQILCAAFGGFAINVLDLIDLKNIPKPERPDFKDFFYWLPFVVWPVLGAGLVFIYIQSGIELKPLLAVNIGISAPLILRSMAQVIPPKGKTIDPGENA